jgi:hypothetical protein
MENPIKMDDFKVYYIMVYTTILGHPQMNKPSPKVSRVASNMIGDGIGNQK